ncbi:hypothetical protein BJX65DRAFT_300967 [Aspergillus insuetus]
MVRQQSTVLAGRRRHAGDDPQKASIECCYPSTFRTTSLVLGIGHAELTRLAEQPDLHYKGSIEDDVCSLWIYFKYLPASWPREYAVDHSYPFCHQTQNCQKAAVGHPEWTSKVHVRCAVLKPGWHCSQHALLSDEFWPLTIRKPSPQFDPAKKKRPIVYLYSSEGLRLKDKAADDVVARGILDKVRLLREEI